MGPLILASFWQGLLVVLFIPLCLLLCLMILIQKPRGGGLTSAFGGAGGGQQMFGGKSGDILTWITVSFFAAFIFLGVLLVLATRNDARANFRPAPSEQQSQEPAPSQTGPTGAEPPVGLPAQDQKQEKDAPATAPKAAPVETPKPAAPAEKQPAAPAQPKPAENSTQPKP